MSKILKADDIVNRAKDAVELLYMATDALPVEHQDPMRSGLMDVAMRLAKALRLLDAAVEKRRLKLELAA